MKLLDIIKTVSERAVENSLAIKLMYGIVTSTAPLKVTVEQRLLLTENMLIFPHSCEEKLIKIGEGEYSISKKLQTGDKLILLRVGDDFLVIDKVGSYGGKHIVTGV